MGRAQNWTHNLLVLVGLVFPTESSSWSSDPTAPLNPHKFSLFPLLVTLPLDDTDSDSLFSSLFSPSSCPPPSFTQFSYLQLEVCGGFHDCILVSLVWMGSNVIIPNIEYISLEMVVVALKLISATKRSPDSDTPQGNTQPLGRYVVSGIRTPEQIINGQTWACLSCIQKRYGLTMGFGPNFDS